MRFRPVLFLSLLAVGCSLATPRDAVASALSRRPGPGYAAATMQLFGSFSPGIVDDDSRSGFGIALRWRLSNRVALALDATRLSNSGGSITPFGAGIHFGPDSRGALHPWVELGATYVRVTETAFEPIWGLSSAGNPRDSFRRLPLESRSEAWGPYFGAGMEWSASEHVGLFGAVRAYNWKESTFSKAPWDGVVALRSGLSFSF